MISSPVLAMLNSIVPKLVWKCTFIYRECNLKYKYKTVTTGRQPDSYKIFQQILFRLSGTIFEPMHYLADFKQPRLFEVPIKSYKKSSDLYLTLPE